MEVPEGCLTHCFNTVPVTVDLRTDYRGKRGGRDTNWEATGKKVSKGGSSGGGDVGKMSSQG